MTSRSPTTSAPPEPIAPDIRDHWTLDPDIVFLNHGSFGACPRPVLAEQQRWRDVLEREPVEFFERKGPEYLETALQKLGAFIKADHRCLGFVTNATEGAHAVIRSMDLAPGDEIVSTTHAYDAVANLIGHVTGRAGAEARFVPIDLPFDEDQFVAAVAAAITDRTRLVVVDHITSISAIILPVSRIIELCRNRGIDILIDGAHAPGMLDLDVESLGATYYTGNLHKWVCAPKGAGFLFVQPDKREQIHPSTISNNYGQGFNREFAWQGTRDVTPWLTVPKAIDFFARLGWDRVREHNHNLAVWARAMLLDAWNVAPITDLSGDLFGSMFTLPLPEPVSEVADRLTASRMLFEQHGVEVPVVEVNGRRMIRPSCQVYNRHEDYERLARAVTALWER